MGYKVSGKRSGPPPKRGPNPQVPPVKMRVGGGADMGAPRGNVSPAVDKATRQQNINQRNVVREGRVRAAENLIDRPTLSENITNKINQFKIDPFNMIPGVGTVKMIGNILGPIADTITEGYRTKKARGENFLSPKVTLPSTRDYYRTTGKQLDVMSPEGKAYLISDNRLSNTITPPPSLGGENSTNMPLCPDGVSMPPCPVVPVVSAKGGKYFDEQTTNVKGKNKTGPIPGGNTPQIPTEEFMKYKKFKKNRVVSAYVGKAVKQPTETKKEFSTRHAEHTPFGKRGGGIAIRGMNFKGVL